MALSALMGAPITVLAADTAPSAETATGPADAAAAPEGSDSLEAVVVTGSLLAIDGAHAPTPVTVVTTEQLATAAPATLTEGLLQLPLFKGSPSAQSQGTGTTGNNGASYLNLRGLGTQRTLVLLDGRRVVSATSAGSVDVEELPEALISQVEVVTGGASAAYGSDAVAGVVNFRLDNKFTGVKGSLQYGQSDYNDDKNYKASIAAGSGFFDDKLHIVASLEHYDNKGIATSDRRPWAYEGTGAIPNPAVTAGNPASPSNPAQIVVQNPYSSVAALGGLITNTALRGTTFGTGGTPQQFQYGSLVSPTLMQGGGGYNPSLQLVLQPDQSRTAAFSHATFDVNSSFRVFAEAMIATNDLTYHSLPTFELSSTAFTIFKDNAYLPASIAAAMNNPAAPISSVKVGRISPDFAIPELLGTSDLQRYVVGFDGDINRSVSQCSAGSRVDVEGPGLDDRCVGRALRDQRYLYRCRCEELRCGRSERSVDLQSWGPAVGFFAGNHRHARTDRTSGGRSGRGDTRRRHPPRHRHRQGAGSGSQGGGHWTGLSLRPCGGRAGGRGARDLRPRRRTAPRPRAHGVCRHPRLGARTCHHAAATSVRLSGQRLCQGLDGKIGERAARRHDQLMRDPRRDEQ
jgi:hypothetical protein